MIIIIIIHNFWGDLSDILAKTETLMLTSEYGIQVTWVKTHRIVDIRTLTTYDVSATKVYVLNRDGYFVRQMFPKIYDFRQKRGVCLNLSSLYLILRFTHP